MTPKPKDLAKRRQILEFMGERECMTKQISEGTQTPTSTIHQFLRYMEAEGLITRSKQGQRTYWTATGRKVAEQEVLNARSPFYRRDDCLLARVWR